MNKTLFFISFIILILHANAEEFTCKRFYPKEYTIFYYNGKLDSTPFELNPDINGNPQKGQLLVSICGLVPIPESCGQSGLAKLVYESAEEGCVIVHDSNAWTFVRGHSAAANADMFSATKEKDSTNYALQFNFVCSKKGSSDYGNRSYVFQKQSQLFEVNIHDESGCGHYLPFLATLDQHNYISAAIFLIIGSVLCLLGLNFYKNMLVCFVPTMIAILAFYLYMGIVEKNALLENQWFLIVLTLLLLVLVIGLAIFFTGVVYGVLSWLISSYRKLRSWPFGSKYSFTQIRILQKRVHGVHHYRSVLFALLRILPKDEELLHNRNYLIHWVVLPDAVFVVFEVV